MFKPSIGRLSPRLPAFALVAVLGAGAVVGTGRTPNTTPSPDEPSTPTSSQPYRYIGPYDLSGETPPAQPPGFEDAEEVLALALCGELAQHDQHPGAVLSGYEDRYTALEKEYKLNDQDHLGAVSLQFIATDYCREEMLIFGSKG